MQAGTGLGRAVHIRLIGRRNLGDLGDIAGDIFGHAGLLLGGRGDLLIHVADRFYREGNLAKPFASQIDLLHAFGATDLAAFDGLNSFNGTLLHAVNDLLDLGG